MKKIVKIIVESTCKSCPYCRYDPYYDISHNSGYDCEHPESIYYKRIVDDWEVDNSNNKKPKGWPPIPKECPLPEVGEST